MHHRKRTELRRAMQSVLIAMGHDLGPTGADGNMGTFTSRALRIESNAQSSWHSEPDLLRSLQAILIALGYDLGPTQADGRMGPYTRSALRKAAGWWPCPAPTFNVEVQVRVRPDPAQFI